MPPRVMERPVPESSPIFRREANRRQPANVSATPDGVRFCPDPGDARRRSADLRKTTLFRAHLDHFCALVDQFRPRIARSLAPNADFGADRPGSNINSYAEP